jgi:GNAT superfamily N-acetyltransferase
LYVFKAFRNRGVGSSLVEYALKLLDERFPLVTVPEELLPLYEGFFRRFGFRLSGSRVGLYRVGKREFFFNRTLA